MQLFRSSRSAITLAPARLVGGAALIFAAYLDCPAPYQENPSNSNQPTSRNVLVCVSQARSGDLLLREGDKFASTDTGPNDLVVTKITKEEIVFAKVDDPKKTWTIKYKVGLRIEDFKLTLDFNSFMENGRAVVHTLYPWRTCDKENL